MHTRLEASLPEPARLSSRPVARGALLGIVAAVGSTSVLFLLGNIGSGIQVVTGWAPDGADIRYIEVVLTATFAVLASAALLAVLDRRHAAVIHGWSVIVAVVALASTLPLWRLEVDLSSKVWLTLMHLATAACAVGAQALTRRVDPTRCSPATI